MLNRLKNEIFQHIDVKKLLMVVSIVLFAVLTFKGAIGHVPWRDEATSWNVAKWLNFYELIDNMKYQGHMFLWYMILKPFAMNDFCYPYSMLIVNWLFVLSAIIIMWKYAKFNPILKFFITFSYPMFQFYPIVAREYGIGILLLFILAVLFKKRLEHPYIYTIIIFFAANIGTITLAGVSSIGLIFLYDLLKDCANNKTYKRFIFPFSMFLFTSWSIWFQLGHHVVPEYSYIFDPLINLKLFLFKMFRFKIFNYLSYIVVPATVISGIALFFRNLRVLAFFVLSMTQLAIIFNIYCCIDYHMYFMFIYLIIAYWIYLDIRIDTSFTLNKIFCVLFSILCFMTILKTPQNQDPFNSSAKGAIPVIRVYIPDIENNVKIYSSSIFDVHVIAPYFNKADYRYYDGKKMFTPKNFEPCWFPETESYNFDDYYDNLDSGYIIMRHNIDYVKNLKLKKFVIDSLYEDKNLFIGKLIKIDKHKSKKRISG